jgi:hypothetical protein
VLVENLVKTLDKETKLDLTDNLMDIIDNQMDIIDLEIITFKDKTMVMNDGMLILFFSISQNSYFDGYQRNNENDRYAPRNRSSSFNDYSRQDGRNQQQNRQFSRFNRNDSETSSTQRSGNSMSQRSTEDKMNSTQPKRNRQSDEENQTQEQNPWERSTRQ